jgi:methyl-accepting chemotaxis protein
MSFNKKSILRRVLFAYLGFGIALGSVFPVYADFFVQWNPGTKGIFIAGCIIAGIVLGIANFMILKIIMLKPMNRIAMVANEIANKDVRHECSMESHDTLGEIINSFNSMAGTLRTIVKDIIATSGSLNDSASGLKETTASTRRDAQHQKDLALQGESVVSNMQSTKAQVDQAISSIIGSTTNAEQLASSGRTVVSESAEAMMKIESEFQSMETQIARLSEQSEKIGSVVTVIRGIAEQTNLLALNAAIEAARAGEMGRGFAVVADEVRNLANQTAKSTEEITTIIQELQTEAQEAHAGVENSARIITSGVASTNNSSAVLNDIAESIDAINLEFESICISVSENNQYANELTQIVHELAEISERTMDDAELNEEGAKRFNELSMSLNQLVSDFRT